MIYNLDTLYQKIIDFFEKQNDLNIPFLISKGQIYTKQDIINEFKNHTDTSQLFVNDMILLAIDMLSRGKEKIENFELNTEIKDEKSNEPDEEPNSGNAN